MYLDAVNQIRDTNIIDNDGSPKPNEVFEKWKYWYPSQISHHGEICCEIAREWVTATDFSELNGGNLFTGPRWLRQRFNWGASSFPIFWCEAVRKNTLDCGALAALADEVFTVRGVKSLRIQLVQKFSQAAANQWACSWGTAQDAELHWIDRDLIYHEGCSIVVGDREVKVWDASAGWWIDPKSGSGYGSLQAIRLSAAEDNLNAGFNWGEHRIPVNQWYKLG